MRRREFITLAGSAAVAWPLTVRAQIEVDPTVSASGGKSDFLKTTLTEDGNSISLEAVIFKPPGEGPFPLAIFNHGSTGRNPTPERVKRTWFSIELAGFLNQRGWLVAFPQRRGRGKSDGFCDEELLRNGKVKFACDEDTARTDSARALSDIEAAIGVLRERPDVAPGPILMGGHSRGGVLSIAYAGTHSTETLGVLNFVGGWINEGCRVAEPINQELFQRGARFDRPTIWLYGQGDSFYSIAHSRKNFVAFEKGGGKGQFFEFDKPMAVGHNVIHHPDLWTRPVGEYLDALNA